ncbi:hypothetical protein [Winogradskyella flava]|uniref:Uncharacterized protein n=1 Tax=Winogradskyella flava TaxID=1884876 RepID=A0A842IPM2_9FLAO|nr:hypothetical protein [Winogradskyella flava]MBC2844950.1 hypothetical protein [Winogradskyella flava]
MKTQLITLGLIGLFFYSCSENNNSDKKNITEDNLQTITEHKSNVAEIEIAEEELQTIVEQKSNVAEIEIVEEELQTITEQKNK